MPAYGVPGYNRMLASSGNHRRYTVATADFMTIREVCDLLKIAEGTAYDLCRTGKLAGAAKVGNQWRVNRAKLLAWLEAGGDRRRDEEADHEG